MNYARMREIYTGSQNEDFYEQLLSDYDQMIDWESRLKRETPFFEKIIADYDVKTILDAGCGTGRHCFHFRTLGVKTIVGTDSSRKIIELAQHRAEALGSDIRFIQASFTELAERVTGSYHLVCCLGNAISHLLTYDDLELALSNFRRLITTRGIVLIHCLNWERRLTQQERFFPPKSHPTPEGDKIFFRFFDFHEELVSMNLVIFQKEPLPANRWTNRISSTTLRPWRREILRMALKDAGLTPECEFGGTDSSPYHPTASPDYIVLARKA